MFPHEPPAQAPYAPVVGFLRAEAEAIARRAARIATDGLPIGGASVRRFVRKSMARQVLEFARLLELYGEDGARFYGESQRRHIARRLDQGFAVMEAIEESALLLDATIERWGARYGSISGEAARVLVSAFSELAAQAADVYVTQQRAEASALQDAALLQTIVSHVDEAIVVIEASGVISFASPALERVLGIPPRVLVGLPQDRLPPLLERLNPRDAAGHPILLDQLPHEIAHRTQKASYAANLLVRRPSGDDAVLEVYAAPVFDEEEELRGVVMSMRDRTERALQVRELERAYDELRKLHARLLSRSRLEAVGELANRTAHALNNQLNVITLRLHRLVEVPGARDDAEAVEHSVRAIAALVGRLQELAAARPPGPPTSVEVEPLLAQSTDFLRAERTRFSYEPAGKKLPPVRAERDTLAELLTSLLLGARDTTPSGEKLLLTTSLEDEQVVIRIGDRGPGLSSEQIAELLDPLVPYSGERGLSLALGRQALARWGGALEIRPRPRGGTLFEVRLVPSEEPAEELPAREAPVERERPKAKRAVHHVLVVDDDPDNAAMLAELLAEAGAVPEVTRSGREAIEAIDRSPPEAALVDLLLPDIAGWEVVQALQERAPGARVAVVSGLSEGDDPKAKAVDAYFRKPVDPIELLDFLGLTD